MQTGGGSGSQEPSLGTLESLPHALLEPSLSPALGLSWSGRQWGGAESQKGWGGEDEVGGSRVDQSRVHACPGSWREAVRAGREGAQVGGQAHHTEHLWAGFMGESLGQWKARPNSSNWDTLPSTLERDPQRVGPRGHQTPAVLSHPTTSPPPRPPPHRHKEGMSPRQPGGGPVVLGCMLVGQHLQVDGLRPPLDAPVLGPDEG